MKKCLIVASAALCVASAAFAQPYPANGYIGVYSDMAGTQCCSTVPAFAPTNLYVIAHLAGVSAPGITGAEFRLEFQTNPTGSASFSFMSAGNVTIGDPIDLNTTDPTPPAAEGVNIGFPVCQTGPAVLLGTLQAIVFNAAWTGAEIRTKARNPPNNPDPQFDCPLYTDCTPGEFNKICITIPDGAHGQSINFVSGINLAGCNTGCLPVAVAEKNWSAVKGLYR